VVGLKIELKRAKPKSSNKTKAQTHVHNVCKYVHMYATVKLKLIELSTLLFCNKNEIIFQ